MRGRQNPTGKSFVSPRISMAAGALMLFIISIFSGRACESIAPSCCECYIAAVVESGGHTTTGRQLGHANPNILWFDAIYLLTTFPQPPILRSQTRQHMRDLVAYCSADGLLATA